MDIKKIIYLTLILGGICSCSLSNKSDNTTTNKTENKESTIHNVNLFEDFCKKAVNNRVYFNDLIKIELVKDKIVSEYSQRFYDVLSTYGVGVSTPLEYKNGVYNCICFNNKGYNNMLTSNISFTYNPSTDNLDIKIDLDEVGNDVIDSYGEIKLYPPENWDIRIINQKNDFGEVTNRIASAIFSVTHEEVPFGGEFEYEYVIQLFNNCMLIWTNKLEGTIKDIRIKDFDNGNIYNIKIAQEINRDNQYVPNDIGGYLSKGTIMQLINIIEQTSQYSISIRDSHNKNITIPKNIGLDYLFEAYYKICFMQDIINSENNI